MELEERERGRKGGKTTWKGGGGKRGRMEEREERGREEGGGIRGRGEENDKNKLAFPTDSN